MKAIVLKHALMDRPKAEDFVVLDKTMPKAPDQGVLARVIDLSLDPYVGSRIRGRHMGEPAPRPLIDPIPGAAIVEVMESKSAAWTPGEIAHTMDAAWAEYVPLPAHALRRIDTRAAPPAAHLSVLGMPGLTAWAGISQLARVTEKDTLLVDAAAGTVGGTAGQLAKAKGARVFGIAGGPEKCALVTKTYGFDACVDYKSADWPSSLDTVLTTPPTVHFENVSVDFLTLGLQKLALYGRVILCGVAADYHAVKGPAQIPLGLVIGKRAQVMGLVVYDFYPRWDEFVADAAPLLASGRLAYVEDRVTGLGNAPALFERLMLGMNTGKCVVGVSPLYCLPCSSPPQSG